MEELKIKKKSNKFLFLLIVILIGLGVVYFTLYLTENKKENTNKKEDNTKEPISQETVSYHDYEDCNYDLITESEGKIYLDEQLIYECKSTSEYGCYISNIVDDNMYCNTTDSLILITDNQKDLLYDYKNKKVILEADSFYSVIYDDSGKVAYFVFYKDDKAGLVSMTGEVVLEPIYDSVTLSHPGYDGEYSLKNGIVAVEKDDKVGVLVIETGEEEVPFEYDDIRIYENNYILIKDNKATLTDLELNLILDDGFNDMVIFNNVLFTEKNKELSFYDLKGEKILNDMIKINKSYANHSETGYTAYSMDQYNSVITIEIFDEDKWDYDSCYNLYVNEKKLEKIVCGE